jgi:methyl-accepting chemotaxis protein
VVKVESGVTLAQEAGTAITSIDEHTQQVVMTVSDISNAVGEQRNATNEIARHVERIAQMSETNTLAIQSTGETAKQLSSLSQSLEASVARFRL